jgi:hypothetical protein
VLKAELRNSFEFKGNYTIEAKSYTNGYSGFQFCYGTEPCSCVYGSRWKGIECECFSLVQDLEHLLDLLAGQFGQNRILDEFLDGQNLSNKSPLFTTVKYEAARDNIVGQKRKGRSEKRDIGQLELIMDIAERIELSAPPIDCFWIESHMMEL